MIVIMILLLALAISNGVKVIGIRICVVYEFFYVLLGKVDM